ncbi:hypothetical protein [Halovivax limisalsi]|uniref:hypothetical protein n=1 Tax=Halovivax limisalsi TaxID=1453760 RepID=UPI001FFC7ADF|nr:hypothetical protein [Halovivax limisalsi]
MPDEPTWSTGPPDSATIELLETQFDGDRLVSATSYRPDRFEPRLLVVEFDPSLYPPSIEACRLDVRWFSSGDFSIRYLERHEPGTWECRWDRHPNGHNSRLHFHEPPDGTPGVDLNLEPLHPLDVYATVTTAIERRIESCWDGTSEHDGH